jgi:hypothetical protein
VQAKNPTRFNYKNETKIEQGYNNKTYQKTNVEQTESN